MNGQCIVTGDQTQASMLDMAVEWVEYTSTVHTDPPRNPSLPPDIIYAKIALRN